MDVDEWFQRNEEVTMSTREARIQIFQDTLNWIKSDPALSASVARPEKARTMMHLREN